ncbi:hypothetical protein [Streptomyces sp. NPDC014894]|uniref:hypothetical protein n=1 Tax=Streptomyces sp. NPDC014894 TaxID=3364931 RepID=UPI0036FA138D
MDVMVTGAAAIVVAGAVWSVVGAARRALERAVTDIVVRTLAGARPSGPGGTPRRPDLGATPVGELRATVPFGGAGVNRRGGRAER